VEAQRVDPGRHSWDWILFAAATADLVIVEVVVVEAEKDQLLDMVPLYDAREEENDEAVVVDDQTLGLGMASFVALVPLDLVHEVVVGLDLVEVLVDHTG
jgi:hypothetical protein